MVDVEQCSIQADVCPTAEYQSYPSSTTTTNQDTNYYDHVISTSTTSSTAVPITDIPPTMSLSTPLTTTTTVLTSVSLPSASLPSASLPSAIEKKFTVEIVSDTSSDEMEEPVENVSTAYDVPCSQDQRMDNTIPNVVTMPIVDDSCRVANLTAACSLRSDSSSSFYDDRMPRAPKVDGGRTYQHNAPSPVFPGYVNAERPPEKPATENLSQLQESFSIFMYAILQVFRNPAMESFVNDLDNKYGNRPGPVPVPHEYDQDPEYLNLQMQ